MADDATSGGNVRPVCIDHVTLPVGDLERSLAFYRAALVDGMGWNEIDEEGSPAFGIDNGAPGPRAEYSPGYHGAFLIDPDGHNVEAVWHAPQG